jgi:hypothetical protein
MKINHEIGDVKGINLIQGNDNDFIFTLDFVYVYLLVCQKAIRSLYKVGV